MAGIAQGVIIGWIGTAASIPSGWVRVAALDGKHPKGAAAGVDPGTTGGAATHTHTQAAHTHDLSHGHTSSGNSTAQTSSASLAAAGATNVPSSTHTHPVPAAPTATIASGSSSGAIGSASNDPLSATAIWCESDGTPTTFPEGCLVFHTETTTWGTITPAWIGGFFKGAAAGADGGSTTGANSHSHTVAAHTHTGSTHSHTTTASAVSNSPVGISAGTTGRPDQTHTHNVTFPNTATGSTTGTSGGYSTTAMMPPYMNLLAVDPNGKSAFEEDVAGVICLWLGTIASIPTGWALCDGGIYNGHQTPDLRGRYVQSSSLGSVGNTGGSLAAHTHTDNHTHTMNSHTHTSVWSSSSNLNEDYSGAGAVSWNAGSHSHSGNASAATPPVGAASTSPASATGEPEFRTVAFIMYVDVPALPITEPALVVEIAFASSPDDLDAVLNWTDVSEDVRSVNTSRGRSKELEQFGAGTASIVLSNADRTYDPMNQDSPYWTVAGTQITPMKRIRVRAVEGDLVQPIFEGFIDNWTQKYGPGPNEATVEVTATDAFLVFNNTDLSSGWYSLGVNADAPKVWFRLGEAATDTTVYDSVQGIAATKTGNGLLGQEGLLALDGDGSYYGPINVSTLTDYIRTTDQNAMIKNSSGSQRFRFTGVSGQAVSTPDHADFNSLSAIDVRCRVSFPEWGLPGWTHFAGQGGVTTLESWHFGTSPSDNLFVRLSVDGTNYQDIYAPNWNPGSIYDPNEVAWVAFTAVHTGSNLWTVTFYHTDDTSPPADITTWTQIVQYTGINLGGTTLYNSSTMRMAVGARGSQNILSASGGGSNFDFYSMTVKSSVNGSTIAAVDFTDVAQWNAGDSTGTTGTHSGKVWTVHTSPLPQGYVVGPAAPFSVEAVIALDENDALGAGRIIVSQGTAGMYYRLMLNGANELVLVLTDGTNTASALSTATITDAAIHHVAGTYDATGQVRLYIDGVDVTDYGTDTVDQVNLTSATSLTLGGQAIGAGATYGWNWAGWLDEVAIYDRALSADQILAHYNESVAPGNDQLPGERIEAVLDSIGWPEDRREVDAGQTVLQAGALETDALSYMQQTAQSDLIGAYFIDRTGAVRFIEKTALYDRPVVTEFVAEDHALDLEPSYSSADIRNSVTVSRNAGKEITSEDQTSIRAYLRQSWGLTGLMHAHDEESLIASQKILEQYSQPSLRVSQLTFTPKDNEGALFPTLLALELQDWVDVTWTPAQTGDPITLTCVIEQIEHQVTDGETQWTTTLSLSPAPVGISAEAPVAGDPPIVPGQEPTVGQVQTALEALDERVDALEDVVGTDSGWVAVGSGGGAPAFENSWVNFGGGFQGAAYRKIGNQVFLRGLVKNGTLNAAIFTLPAGYRPLAQVLATGMTDARALSVSGTTSTSSVQTDTDNTVPNPNLTATVSSHAHGLQNHTHSHSHAITHNHTVTSTGSFGQVGSRVDISAAGVVIPNGGSNGYQSLDGISFFVD